MKLDTFLSKAAEFFISTAFFNTDDNVAAGRKFVESYVIFTHYVEELHGLIKGGAAHHGDGGDSH